MCEAESSAAVIMLWKQRRRLRQATEALSGVEGGAGAGGVSGGRDQAMRARVRQRASEEFAVVVVKMESVCSVGGGRGMWVGELVVWRDGRRQ